MIPDFTISGVLPPYIHDPTTYGENSPYSVSASELVSKFCTSAERAALLDGLLNYRQRLQEIGIHNGIQWINGSFAENVEVTRERPPADIDIVTLAETNDDRDAFDQLVEANLDLFDPQQSKGKYLCDAYFIDLSLDRLHIVSNVVYWYGLFTHQRESFLWKGILELSLTSDDCDARIILDNWKQTNA